MKQNEFFGCTRLAAEIIRQIESSELRGWSYDENNIKQEASGITFHDYMHRCLYDPVYGYYTSGDVRIGKQGDFYTSSSVGDILASILAAYCLRELPGRQFMPIIEWGAGTGQLSAQMAQAAAQIAPHAACSMQYWLVDDHPAHRTAQQQRSGQYDGYQQRILASSDAWELLAQQEGAVVIANELLDAFAVHRVKKVDGQLVELGVTGDFESGLSYIYLPLSNPNILKHLKRDRIQLRDGQITELNLAAEAWLRKLFSHLRTGKLIIIDYGHEAQEYTAAHRMDGTLMCYSKHRASDQPFLWAGEQDITAQVCFTSIRHAAEEAGFRVSYYQTQKQFLIDNGVLQMLGDTADLDPFSEAHRRNRAIRQLLLSDQMSELFKVMIVEKQE